jgi:cob(I)alamin adenosyltransferase
MPYLNRLSDALFVMARYENHERGVTEPLWNKQL